MDENDKEKTRTSLDYRRLEDGYFKYSILLARKRHNIHDMDLPFNVDDAIIENFLLLKEMFEAKANDHRCGKPGCTNCMVADGNLKNSRTVCQMPGCMESPMKGKKCCKLHKTIERKIDGNNNQELVENDGEFHVEAIIGKRYDPKTKQTEFKVKWVGYSEEESTFEPRKNIPRVLVELYSRYGRTDLTCEVINKGFTKSGHAYVELFVENSDYIILPAEAMEVNEEAYHRRINASDLKCNTLKDQKRFHTRTGGVLVGGRPCGMVNFIEEIANGESIRQVAATLERVVDDSTECLVYDDGCHLRRHIEKIEGPSNLKGKDVRIDRVHFPNHIDPWCIENLDPDDSPFLDGVNTEVMEQLFSWMSKYSFMVRQMNRPRHNFFLLDILDKHNFQLDHDDKLQF